ncbi:unnamed protein product [Cylicostephanus goldi]|uniref:FYVE-type domain-containing protein n=1 Tax=Cylicostephanus goldi TaxID=71465 RepID=A0A3P6QAD8_CYLGO|nr:unnamed protein product [Cylicostephanus goldi]
MIESLLQRLMFFRKADAELDQIEKQINERKEIARKLVGTHDDAICQICQRTKFADGIGHKCFYCQLRSCARCGGRSQSKNKAIWACSLCQKRQQILAKTGKWFQPDEAQHKTSNAGREMQRLQHIHCHILKLRTRVEQTTR